MPFTVLIALVLAFGLRPASEVSVVPIDQAYQRALFVLIGLMASALTIWGLTHFAAWRARRRGGAVPAWHEAAYLTGRALDIAGLALFALLVHAFDWPGTVGSLPFVGGAIALDEVFILAPFLLLQLFGWVSLYDLERAGRLTRPERRPTTRTSYVVRKARQAWGLVLPAGLVYAIAHDLIAREWPGIFESSYAQLGAVAVLGSLVLVLAPVLVRFAWLTRPLPRCPLRARLEALAARIDFKFTDILIWDTGQDVLNAGVTGALPWFRYVLLTDALIEKLDERQVEAVFGHEVGHVAHRHLAYIGFFCLGSLGIMALICQATSALSAKLPFLSGGLSGGSLLVLGLQALCAVGLLGTYFYLTFGYLSRRFERQADVFGCRAMSCDRPTCPPHAEPVSSAPDHKGLPKAICPVGIRTFASALADVADLNGLDCDAGSWRHGSIRRRITFLEGLEGRPEAEGRFQIGTSRLRAGLGAVLILTLALAAVTGALEQL